VALRQTVNSICRSFSQNSDLLLYNGKCNHFHKTKATNQLISIYKEHIHMIEIKSNDQLLTSSRPWYWEGNVQSTFVSFLVQNNYTIRSVADTASRISGKDIIAISRDNDELWVSVKGYSDNIANIQAHQWFSGVIYNLFLYHGENPDVHLANASPEGFVTYRNLIPRIDWLKTSLPLRSSGLVNLGKSEKSRCNRRCKSIPTFEAMHLIFAHHLFASRRPPRQQSYP